MTKKMDQRAKQEEYQRLCAQITEWNANRLDLFELSLPNEELEFHGVMRFFFQDAGSKVATKCIRVSSTASTRDVLDILVEKFRPDMRMLSMPSYALYEVHVNGEERRLNDLERPLLVQLNWGQDDREGRFLLKNEEEKTQPIHGVQFDGVEPVGGFKRKLSKREKKEKKKKEKEAKLKGLTGKENESPSTAEKLYNELPETSFTRSISNPEAVMRRRRQLKLEKKLQQFRSKDGGPDTGGTLKIYGESLCPDVPYKTLLLSTADNAIFVVRETLVKYGMEKEDPNNFCLLLVHVPPDREYHGNGAMGKERILDEDECPLAILMQHPPSKGTIMFQLRRRAEHAPKKKKTKKSGPVPRNDRHNDLDYSYDSPSMPQEELPYLLELSPDGREPNKPKKHRLPLDVTEVGGEKSMSVSGQYLQLYGPDIHPRHCVIAHTGGIVTVTPTRKDAETYVNHQRIYETTMLQHGMTVRFGKMHLYRFCDPNIEEQGPVKRGQAPAQQRSGQGTYDNRGRPQNDPTANFETTFDLDGHIETVTNPEDRMRGHPGTPVDGYGPPGYEQGRMEEILPATLEYREEGEDAFLAAIISEVNGGAVQFKLAPTYTLYMSARYKVSNNYRPDLPPLEKAHRLSILVKKIAGMIQQTIHENNNNAGALSFWMANASELLHFYKQDRDITRFSLESQDVLAEAVQTAFRHLVRCMQMELHNTMIAFLEETDDDEQEEVDVLQTLSSAMSLLRRCRVNAALTIQLFSQLFHYINMWLFNELVLEPRLGLCTQAWGKRLKRRLARVEMWAEKQGLELAADCHLARIIQAAHLLQAPKSSPDDIASISSACFKLNSMQLRALLQNYIPSPDEPRIPHDLIESVVAVAENTADELTRSDGRDVRLEEERDLQLPFLLPEDGYSCDIVRGVPNGLAEFIDPLSQTGICMMMVQPSSPGLWTIHMMNQGSPDAAENARRDRQQREQAEGLSQEPAAQGLPKEPEVVSVTFPKVNGSIGLSIVAAKGENQDKRGIYIKSVVSGGGAAQDGRLQAGDQLLEVDNNSLVDLPQEKAAELMTQTGQVVTLKVAKQGAIYHGLATLLSHPSPVMQRASPQRNQGPPPAVNKPRPRSEDVGRFQNPAMAGKEGSPGRHASQGEPMHNGPRDYGMDARQRPLNQQYGARSSPMLSNSRPHEYPREEPYGYKQPQQQSPHQPQPSSAPYYNNIDPRETNAMRSKSTSNLDRQEGPAGRDHRPIQSVSTLPRNFAQQPSPQQQPQRSLPPHQRGFGMNRPASQPDLNQKEEPQQPAEVKHNYENYPPHPMHPLYQEDRYQRERYPSHPDHFPNRQAHRQYSHEQLNTSRSEVKTSTSMINVGDPRRPDINHNRPKSEHYDQNRWADPRQMQPGYSSIGPGGEPAGSRAYDQDVPRSQANNQQYQQNFYNNTMPRNQEPAPPFDQLRRPQEKEESRGKPGIAAKPTIAPKPVTAQEVPRMQMDHRKSQPNFFDPRQQKQEGPYHGQAVTPNRQLSSSTTEVRTAQSREEFRREKSPYGRLEHYDRKNESPDLPPPPEVPPELPPPPEELRNYNEDLPPPPPPPAEYDQQIREEQERMMRRMAGLEPALQQTTPLRPREQFEQHRQQQIREQQQRRQQDAMRGQGYPGDQRQGPTTPHGDRYGSRQPEPQKPSPQGNFSPYESTYQNLPPQNRAYGKPDDYQSPYESQPQSQYPYDPKQRQNEPQRTVKEPGRADPGSNRKIPPPVSTKPGTLGAVNNRSGSTSSPSPWMREEREKFEKKKEEDVRRFREQEIDELQSKPYLNPEEQERLRRLRLDQEFQKRVEEVKSRDEEEDEEEADMTEKAAGRARMLRLLQEDLERKRMQKLEDQQQMELEQGRAEMDKLERQERRLQQFTQEREEQKQRQARRQEKRERDTEELLRKQRELREKQRREQEEHQKQQLLEEQRIKERQREELRRKKEMEREQLREMQAARDEEERNLRDAARRQDEQYSQERLAQKMQERKQMMEQEMRRMDRYGRLAFNDPQHQRSPQPSEPPQSNPDVNKNTYAQVEHRTGLAPQPPERRSSYEVANQAQYQYKPTNITNLPAPASSSTETSQSSYAPPRSSSASALRQHAESPATTAKKSVSFDSNLATEIQINERRLGSTSSDGSMREGQVNDRRLGSTSSDGSMRDYANLNQQDYQGQQPGYQIHQKYQPQPGLYGNSNQYQQPASQPAQPSYPYRGPNNEADPAMHHQPQQPNYPYRGPNNVNESSYGAPTTPVISNSNEIPYDPRTPDNIDMLNRQLVVGDTPGVVGANEVYRDPRDRIAAQRASTQPLQKYHIPERMSFRDKMKMFAEEAGEQNTPQEKPKISRAQRAIESNLNGR